MDDKVERTLAESFKALDFRPRPRDPHRFGLALAADHLDHAGRIPHPLVPPRGRHPRPACPWRRAQSLHFLNYLIAEPIKAAALYRSGVLVQIPRPEAYAIHKLIVANRRPVPTSSKSRKDRAQAALLIEALAEDRPDELREAYEDAMERGPQWRAHIGATLKRMPETAAKLAAL